MNDTSEVKQAKPPAKESLPKNKKEPHKKTVTTQKTNALINKENKRPHSPQKPPAAPVSHPAAAQQPQKKGGGTAISIVALLVAVGTLTVGYQALQQSNSEQQAIQKRLSDAESSLSNSESIAQEARNTATSAQGDVQASQSSIESLKSLASSLEEKLAQVDSQLANISTNSNKLGEVETSQQTLQSKLSELNNAIAQIQSAPNPSKADWLLAEARHLIVNAQHQATLGQNASIAAIALETANKRLADIGDASLASVRKIISDNSIALRNVATVDVASIALILSNLEAQTDGLPLANVASQQFTPSNNDDTADSETSGVAFFADKVWADIKSLVTVRRSNDEISPALLPPGQRFFLQQNLRLKLEAARLALLQGDTKTFHTSIKTARQWIEKYFNTEATATNSMLSALAPYSDIDLNPSIPDAQDALDAFDQWQKQNTTAQSNANAAEESQS